MSAIGKSGARSAGCSGSRVPGCRCGGTGSGRSACRLYQWVGTAAGISVPRASVRGATDCVMEVLPGHGAEARSEERRVGKECRIGGEREQCKEPGGGEAGFGEAGMLEALRY